MRRTLIVGLAAAALLAATPEARAQTLAAGVRGDYSFNYQPSGVTGEDESGTFGVGAKLAVTIPIVGIKLEGTGDYFFPDCGDIDCDLYAIGLNLLYAIPTPLIPIDPYLGAGVVRLGQSVGDIDATPTGGALIAGVSLGLGLNIFGEVRYQIFEGPDQTVASLGIMFPIIPDVPVVPGA